MLACILYTTNTASFWCVTLNLLLLFYKFDNKRSFILYVTLLLVVGSSVHDTQHALYTSPTLLEGGGGRNESMVILFYQLVIGA